MTTKNKIGFLVHSLELINHFGCVWDQLPTGSFEVVLYDIAQGEAQAALKRWSCQTRTTDEILRSGARYRYLVSNHPVVGAYDPPLVLQLADHNIRFMYAAGKTGWNLSPWNQLYDVIMCFGPYHAAAFADVCDALILQMGYPRFDLYFNNAPDRSKLLEKYHCDPTKKTVVWLPTWKDLSSVGLFDEEISRLTDTYNVVIKLHPMMPPSEPHRVDALRRHPFTKVITDTSDNLPLYHLADYMLFDYGGPPMAALYTNKNFLLLNVPGASGDAFTGSDSPDITLRKHFTNIESGMGELAELLADDTLWDEHEVMRANLRKRYFAPYFGFASKVAAEALLHMDHIVAARRHA